MAWLFERTVETAAWVALVAAWCSFGFSLYFLYWFIATLGVESSVVTPDSGPDYALLWDAAEAAGAFVGFALALGGLACVDRFLFDADERVS